MPRISNSPKSKSKRNASPLQLAYRHHMKVALSGNLAGLTKEQRQKKFKQAAKSWSKMSDAEKAAAPRR